MPEVINLEEEFNSWFNEIEVYSLRSERLFDVVPDSLHDQMFAWIKTAYMHGVKTAAQDSVNTLRDYGTALQGCRGAIPIDAIFDHCASNLDCYWQDILKDQ